MTDKLAIVKHYAILIGINYYPVDWSFLKGCVRDVQEIKEHLKKSIAGVNIQILTASRTDSDSSHPAEDYHLLPTYNNVTSALNRIISQALPGDFIYIHFSGHGTTIKPSMKFSNSSTGDLALVLLEGSDGTKIRYLRGLELAFWLKAMVDKGLKITLVLDCCFSGSVVRNESDVRFLSYESKVDMAYPPPIKQSLSPQDEALRPVYRNASMLPNWLVNPDGYTILTACGPTETAKELVAEEGEIHGALSYFLLRTFFKLGRVGGKQQLIYHHLCARFRESREQRGHEQNPMFYGNKSLCFFEHANYAVHAAPIPTIKTRDGGLQLEAGLAHGICKGDQFALYSIASTGSDSILERNLVVVKVTQCRALTSDLEPPGTIPIPVESGLLAKGLTRLSLRRFPIQLEFRFSRPDEWAKALQERQSLDIHDINDTKPGSSISFYMTIIAKDSYEIRDELNQTIQNLPTTPYNLEENADFILDIMEHLARFKLVENLTNESLADPTNPFRDSFSIQLINAAGKIFQPGCIQQGLFQPGCSHPECLVEVSDGDKLKLVVQNKEKDGHALHLHVYDMGSSWEINNLLHGDHIVVPPPFSNQNNDFKQGTTGEWKKSLRMTLPSDSRADATEQKRQYCDDIIKIFLTVQSTSFMSLELPEIGELVERRSTGRGRGQDDYSCSEDWAALNFRIRTYRK